MKIKTHHINILGSNVHTITGTSQNEPLYFFGAKYGYGWVLVCRLAKTMGKTVKVMS